MIVPGTIGALMIPNGVSECLIGTTDAGADEGGGDYWTLCKFKAICSKADVTEYRVSSNHSGNAKINVYADNAGEPGSRVAFNDSGQAVAEGWNILSISSHALVSGTYYWLGIIIDTLGAMMAVSSIGTTRRKAADYSTFTAPNPAGGGFGSFTYQISMAEWGVIN